MGMGGVNEVAQILLCGLQLDAKLPGARQNLGIQKGCNPSSVPVMPPMEGLKLRRWRRMLGIGAGIYAEYEMR